MLEEQQQQQQQQSQSQFDVTRIKLPFRLISDTIGRGSYASIRKAVRFDRPDVVVAIKFINKERAVKLGKIKVSQIRFEISLHQHVTGHINIISFFDWGEDPVWQWIAMEYADGGDLFDKIEADVGVPEDVAHFYFTQLVSAVDFCHSKGVAHRDIKPENILLSADGHLKLGDFGLATLYSHNGKERLANTVCGSPPYVAPEVVAGSYDGQFHDRGSTRVAYRPDRVDIWSCGVVLFVLLVGNTPWDEPTPQSWEFQEYIRGKGRSQDELWRQLPPDTLSLLRGIMKVDPSTRWTFQEVRRHPWFTRANPYTSADGKLKNALSLATTMLENLKIDLSQESVFARLAGTASSDDVVMLDGDDTDLGSSKFASTQPETPLDDMLLDWQRPGRGGMGFAATQAAPVSGLPTPVSASQPVRCLDDDDDDDDDDYHYDSNGRRRRRHHHHHHHSPNNRPSSSSSNTNTRGDSKSDNNVFWSADQDLSEDPSMSQFSSCPSVPLSLTQRARRFRDIIPSHSLTRFVSHFPHKLLLPLLSQSLHRLGVPLTAFPVSALRGNDDTVSRRFKAVDGRKCELQGYIVVDRMVVSGGTIYHQQRQQQGQQQQDHSDQQQQQYPTYDDPTRGQNQDHDDDADVEDSFLEVRFVKLKGDPLEWRRFFKKVVLLCREAVYVPDDVG